MAAAIGIDLGTTNTVAAAVVNGEAFTVATEDDRRLIPSVVAFEPARGVLVGHDAVARRFLDPKHTIFSVKRLIGRAWESDDVQRARTRLPFALSEGPNHDVVVQVRNESFTLPEISAFVLRAVRQMAEHSLGTKVEQAVITVPANFNDLQRAATKIAGKLAGLEVLRILNEPTAAALAYGQGHFLDASGSTLNRNERVAIYDLGGGTFDITILDLAGNVFEVLSTAGDTALGGDDIDQLIVDRMTTELLQKHRVSVAGFPSAVGALRVAAERLKCELSSHDEATTDLSHVAWGEDGRTLPFVFRLTREELENLARALIDRTFEVSTIALERAHLRAIDVDHVLLVGGSTRMPLVPRTVETFFKRPPLLKVHPDEVVALGAAIQAHVLSRRKGKPSHVPVPKELPPVEEPSIRTDSLVPPPPSDVTQRGSTPPPPRIAAPRPGSSIVPVEDTNRVPPVTTRVGTEVPLLIDVTPLSLCVETAGGYCDRLIETNTQVPCDRTRVFSTASDHQTRVIIRVSQGESMQFAQNTYLGEVELSDLPALPRGELRVSVTFELDVNGMLNVRAEDHVAGAYGVARLKPFAIQADPSELERMMQRHALYT